MALREYEGKRDFARTPEPAPQKRGGAGPLLFVVQKHAARRLHYDFRLELDGVLKSWSVPNGPSLDPKVKRLAVMVEDHPQDYASFEGIIPHGEYGAGQVIVWDTGTYSPEEHGRLFEDRTRAQESMREALAKGKASIFLRGHKLKGSWALVKMQHRENDWLLIKHQDEFADPGRDITEDATSVLSGLGVDDLKAGRHKLTPVNPEEIPGSRKVPFPSSISPMLATPTDNPFSDPDWLFEPKLDGFRTIALINNSKVTLFSRRQNDVTEEYPFIIEELKQLPGQMALEKRRRLLESVLRPSGHVRLVEQFEGDGQKVYEATVAMGFEGVIAKRRDSRYEAGRRSKSWLKVKAVLSDDFIIAGFSKGEGNRAVTFGALVLGYYDDTGRLVYAGHVGSGFDEASLADLRQRLQVVETDRCPFAELPPLHAPTTWVKPELVAEIKFTEWTQDGYLRNPVFLRLRGDKAPGEVKHVPVVSHPSSVPSTDGTPTSAGLSPVLEQLQEGSDSPAIEVEGYKLSLSNLSKALWPPYGEHPAITKRDLLVYLVRVSPYLLPHLHDRPLTLTRYPNGIEGERFYQKHIDPLPEFVRSVRLFSEHEGGFGEYLFCNNLATLLWLGQLADIELHTWFSRVSPEPDLSQITDTEKDIDYLAGHPDFIIFDLDPYIYSGKEPKNAEPELNRSAFARVSEVALWLKDILDSLSLASFIKTSGKTGLHIYVPVLRQFDYRAIRSAAQTIGRFLGQQHPGAITSDWAVEKRTGRVFFDYNQNVRGKTLAATYSPRPTPEATVSTPLAWDEVGKIYPTDFTILTVPDRLERKGDLWANMLNSKRDLKKLLEFGV